VACDHLTSAVVTRNLIISHSVNLFTLYPISTNARDAEAVENYILFSSDEEYMRSMMYDR